MSTEIDPIDDGAQTIGPDDMLAAGLAVSPTTLQTVGELIFGTTSGAVEVDVARLLVLIAATQLDTLQLLQELRSATVEAAGMATAKIEALTSGSGGMLGMLGNLLR